MKVRIFITLIVFNFLPLAVSAHPGRTDANGCHTCHTNCPKWGLGDEEYHCHNAKALPQSLPPVTSHKTGVTEPAPQYAKPVVKPVTKPVKKSVTKPMVTSTPIVKPKAIAPAPAKQSWLNRVFNWF